MVPKMVLGDARPAALDEKEQNNDEQDARDYTDDGYIFHGIFSLAF
jgi:hypothetical protein